MDFEQPSCPNCDNRTRRGFTPSQQLRFALWHLWKAKGQVGPFEDFYTDQMHLIIDRANDMLEKAVRERAAA